MTVTFFGHRRTPDSVKPLLKETLRELIEKDRADMFYVGNEGSFDWMVYDTLKELKTEYPFISYKILQKLFFAFKYFINRSDFFV